MSRQPTGPSALSVEDLLAVVAERFGLDAPISASRLTGGYANDVFLLEGHDLATSLWPFCDIADWRRAITDFVTAYRGAGGRVPAEEDDLILPLVRAKRILEVLRAPTDRHPRWDVQLANLEAYQALA